PITNIQLWASSKNDVTPNTNAQFVLMLWSDMPAGSVNAGTTDAYSHPRSMLCSNFFGPGDYTVSFYTTVVENFYDPTSGEMTPETTMWSNNSRPKEPCCQHGSTNEPIVYWLSVYAQNTGPNFQFGWKTSTNHFFDDAVYGHVTAASG